MKKTLLISLLLSLLFILTSCGQGIVGTWKSEDSFHPTTYIFNEDGTGSVETKKGNWNGDDFEYEIRGNHISLRYLSDNTSERYKFVFSDDNQMMLGDDTFTRIN